MDTIRSLIQQTDTIHWAQDWRDSKGFYPLSEEKLYPNITPSGVISWDSLAELERKLRRMRSIFKIAIQGFDLQIPDYNLLRSILLRRKWMQTYLNRH
jgi:hypothetical protein